MANKVKRTFPDEEKAEVKNDTYRLKKGNHIHAAKYGEKSALCGESVAKGENRGVLRFFSELTCRVCGRLFATNRPHLENGEWVE